MYQSLPADLIHRCIYLTSKKTDILTTIAYISYIITLFSYTAGACDLHWRQMTLAQQHVYNNIGCSQYSHYTAYH